MWTTVPCERVGAIAAQGAMAFSCGLTLPCECVGAIAAAQEAKGLRCLGSCELIPSDNVNLNY